MEVAYTLLGTVLGFLLTTLVTVFQNRALRRKELTKLFYDFRDDARWESVATINLTNNVIKKELTSMLNAQKRLYERFVELDLYINITDTDFDIFKMMSEEFGEYYTKAIIGTIIPSLEELNSFSKKHNDFCQIIQSKILKKLRKSKFL
jgi:hypothetical protein